MISSRGMTMAVSAALMATLAFWADGPTTGQAAPTTQKKKKAAPKDSMPIEADGATWSLAATDAKAGKTIKFDYRISDGRIYDVKTNALIGKSEGVKKMEAQVTFNEKSQMPSTFVIHNAGGGRWTGRANYQGESWSVNLRRQTR